MYILFSQIPEEETIRNDYSLNYVLTGSRPQNHIQNTALNTRFVEYPKLKKLLQLKTSLVSSHAHPPTYIQADLRTDRGGEDSSFNLLDLTPARFDVILIDPPLKEYIETYPHLASNPSTANCGGPQGAERDYWDWDELERLPLPQIAASPGFIFLWCGSGQGSTLERGRALLTKWGYRKCEDLVWIKTNHTTPHQQQQQNSPPNAIPAVFTPTKEHCLMGIRGTVRRSTDGHFVHCNVDTDVIVSEPDPTGMYLLPPSSCPTQLNAYTIPPPLFFFFFFFGSSPLFRPPPGECISHGEDEAVFFFFGVKWNLKKTTENIKLYQKRIKREKTQKCNKYQTNNNNNNNNNSNNIR
jgi:hypothetical protein